MSSSLIAFVNPSSGNSEKARDALASTGLFDIRETGPSDLEARIREAVKAGATRIVVAGGDGSIGTGASIVAGTEVELAVMPAGTLNHFARDLGIPEDMDAAAAVAAGTTVMKTDVAYVGDRLFLNTSSIGAYVTFARAREKLEARLPYKLASLLAFVQTFIRMRKLAVELDVEGKRQIYRTPIVFVGVDERELQFPTLGNRIRDGQRGLHVLVVRHRGRRKLLALGFSAIFKGVEEASRSIELDSYMTDTCTITVRKYSARVAVDGEIETMPTPLEYRIERDLLRVVVSSIDYSTAKTLSPA